MNTFIKHYCEDMDMFNNPNNNEEIALDGIKSGSVLANVVLFCEHSVEERAKKAATEVESTVKAEMYVKSEPAESMEVAATPSTTSSSTAASSTPPSGEPPGDPTHYGSIDNRPLEEKTEFEQFLVNKCDAESRDALQDLYEAANYLQNESLMTFCARSLACKVRKMTVEQIRDYFHITEQYTPAELEEVMRDNEWCNEDAAITAPDN